MNTTRAFITIIGAGRFVFGALCSVMMNNVNDNTKIVVYCRPNKARETIEQAHEAIVSLIGQNGEKFDEFSMGIATNKQTLEELLDDDSIRIILVSSNDDELVKFLYNSAHSLLTCVGPGLEKVIADVNSKATNNIFVYTCENNYALSWALSEKSNTNVLVFPCVIDCICSNMVITDNRIEVQAEACRKINLYDPNGHLKKVLKKKTNGDMKLVLTRTDIDREHELKWTHINLVHRLLCYKITEVEAFSVSYDAAKSVENIKIAEYLKKPYIKKYLLEAGTAIAVSMFYYFDKVKFEEEIGTDNNQLMFEIYLKLDAAERMFSMRRMQNQIQDTIGRIIKTSNEKDYKDRIVDTINYLKSAVEILNKILKDSAFKQQFSINDGDVKMNKEVLENVILQLSEGL